MHRLFQSLFEPQSRRPIPGLRPRLEGLEDRLVPSFTVVPSANLGSTANELRSVAAVSTTEAWAVGDKGDFTTLAEHWNGTSWGAVSTPNIGTNFNLLNGVAELSPTNVWAVGQAFLTKPNKYITLVEHFNGTKWSIVKSPNVAGGQNVFNAVTAISPADIWAVGYSSTSSGGDQPLTEHWNGTQWSIVPNPTLPASNNLMLGVSAASSTDVWAVGTLGHNKSSFIEHWNGTSWSLVTDPQPGFAYLKGMAVVSSTDVWAVGQDNSADTLIENWNGSHWTIVPSPNGSGNQSLLNGVAAVSANQVFAFGSSNETFQTLVEEWNGQTWQIVASPNPGNLANQLFGATAVAGQVWAVGSFGSFPQNGGPPYQALILSSKAAGSSTSVLATATSGSSQHSPSGSQTLISENTRLFATGDIPAQGEQNAGDSTTPESIPSSTTSRHPASLKILDSAFADLFGEAQLPAAMEL